MNVRWTKSHSFRFGVLSVLATILAVGLIWSNASFYFVLSLPLAAIILGILSWFGARFDSKEHSEEDSYVSRRPIIVGKILGVVGIVLALLYYYLLSAFSSSSVIAHIDVIKNDIEVIAGQAYKFRTRPQSSQGGGGSYVGFTLPNSLRSNENADYSILRQTADTLIISALAFDAEDRVEAVIGRNGDIVRLVYLGSLLHNLICLMT